MRKTAAALTSILLCTTLLAACGDSGSSSSATTKTATVPNGKLGTTASQPCPPPRINGTTFMAFNATNVSCDTALAGLLSVYRTNKYAGWTCQMRISGRNTSSTCTNNADTTQKFTASWTVS